MADNLVFKEPLLNLVRNVDWLLLSYILKNLGHKVIICLDKE